MDKNKKAGKKGVKGEGEMYKKSNKENVKGKGQQAEHPHHRLSAYEQYAAKYPEQQKVGHHLPHWRSMTVDCKTIQKKNEISAG